MAPSSLSSGALIQPESLGTSLKTLLTMAWALSSEASTDRGSQRKWNNETPLIFHCLTFPQNSPPTLNQCIKRILSIIYFVPRHCGKFWKGSLGVWKVVEKPPRKNQNPVNAALMADGRAVFITLVSLCCLNMKASDWKTKSKVDLFPVIWGQLQGEEGQTRARPSHGQFLLLPSVIGRPYLLMSKHRLSFAQNVPDLFPLFLGHQPAISNNGYFLL